MFERHGIVARRPADRVCAAGYGRKDRRGGTAAWSVHAKTFAWERPLRPADLAALGKDAPAGPILGVRTADLEMKEAMLASDRAIFFTTPHFDGYAAVLVRLASITPAALRDVLVESWLTRVPKRLAATFLATSRDSENVRR